MYNERTSEIHLPLTIFRDGGHSPSQTLNDNYGIITHRVVLHTQLVSEFTINLNTMDF